MEVDLRSPSPGLQWSRSGNGASFFLSSVVFWFFFPETQVESKPRPAFANHPTKLVLKAPAVGATAGRARCGQFGRQSGAGVERERRQSHGVCAFCLLLGNAR